MIKFSYSKDLGKIYKQKGLIKIARKLRKENIKSIKILRVKNKKHSIAFNIF